MVKIPFEENPELGTVVVMLLLAALGTVLMYWAFGDSGYITGGCF